MRSRTWCLALLPGLALGCGAGGGGGEGQAPTTGGEETSSVATSQPDEPGEEPPLLEPAMSEVLDAHNRARAEHCAPPLTWSEELAGVARAWAEELSSRGCPLEHSRGDHGENLYMGTAGLRDPAGVVGVWVEERDGYDFARGGFSMETGHFTQVAWVGTRRVGCATVDCGTMGLWVCNYDPPGNVRGGYRENVLPTSCSR